MAFEEQCQIPPPARVADDVEGRALLHAVVGEHVRVADVPGAAGLHPPVEFGVLADENVLDEAARGLDQLRG